MDLRASVRRAQNAPTHSAYHSCIDAVNRKLCILLIFSLLQQMRMVILYNIPACKIEKSVLSYRHKEVIPMYR